MTHRILKATSQSEMEGLLDGYLGTGEWELQGGISIAFNPNTGTVIYVVLLIKK